jgi:hypothetical protein
VPKNYILPGHFISGGFDSISGRRPRSSGRHQHKPWIFNITGSSMKNSHLLFVITGAMIKGMKPMFLITGSPINNINLMFLLTDFMIKDMKPMFLITGSTLKT